VLASCWFGNQQPPCQRGHRIEALRPQLLLAAVRFGLYWLCRCLLAASASARRLGLRGLPAASASASDGTGQLVANGTRNHTIAAWFFNHSSASSILEHSLVTVALCRPVVEAVQRKDRDLASWFFNHSSAPQIRRAVSSVSLNLAEGFGAAKGNSRLRFESALGSLYEARAGVRVALAWGFVTADAAQAVLQSMESLGGRVFGLVRR